MGEAYLEAQERVRIAERIVRAGVESLRYSTAVTDVGEWLMAQARNAVPCVYCGTLIPPGEYRSCRETVGRCRND